MKNLSLSKTSSGPAARSAPSSLALLDSAGAPSSRVTHGRVLGVKLSILVGIFAILLAGGGSFVALADTPMTEAHIERIKANCVEAQGTLYQLHATDALLRVNRGQLYESISTKLMEPLDSRLALNNLDASSLTTVATKYRQQLMQFRLKYQDYEESMSSTLKINCKNQPVVFYDSVVATREKRSEVHQSALQLHTLINDYKTAFNTFTKNFGERT